MIDICYEDSSILVCIKPPRILSTDEPGGLPELLRLQKGEPDGDYRTVHRLDRVVSGLMVLGKTQHAASELSRQVRESEFEKQYLAVLHGAPAESAGELRDLLGRDKARKMTYVADAPGKDVRPASLDYTVLGESGECSLVRIRLHTGRTHQIRVQFASRGNPLVGERKYSELDEQQDLALFSCCLGFTHPESGRRMAFFRIPPICAPWNLFVDQLSLLSEKENDHVTL